MRHCDVLVLGGGPAGSTCAWALGDAGVDVMLMDRARFPRDKPCAGWVTPAVFRALGVTPADYEASGRTLQPFSAFQTSIAGGVPVTTSFAEPVSYGIRRTEFDEYLLRRVRTPVMEGTPLVSLQRASGCWIVNDSIRASMVVGAGGHFCPVARSVHGTISRRLVLARQAEIPIDADERCRVNGSAPELYFSRDLEGYGWCLRKGDYLNVGIGRRVRDDFQSHARGFLAFLASQGKLPAAATELARWHGHAYVLAGDAGSPIAEGILLAGDAAGIAVRESGEGIGPAVESALEIARTIVSAGGRRGVEDLQPYADWVRAQAPPASVAARIRARLPAFVGRALLRSPAFARLVVERWFLGSSISG